MEFDSHLAGFYYSFAVFVVMLDFEHDVNPYFPIQHIELAT